MAAAARDPDLEGFLALLAATRAPRTVDAYRRDLLDLAAHVERPLKAVTTEEIERYLAELRAEGRSPATIARRTAAARSFYRHLVLLGARSDNPAAAVALPRKARRLPRTLSPSEAERLIDAAAGTTPRSLRDRALVELLYGGGRRAAALPLARAPPPRPPSPAGALPQRPGRRSDPCRDLPRAAPAGREGRARAGAGPPPPAPPLVRHSPARRRRRSPQRPGDARPRRPRDHRALHARQRPPPPRALFQRSPARTPARGFKELKTVENQGGCRLARTRSPSLLRASASRC